MVADKPGRENIAFFSNPAEAVTVRCGCSWGLCSTRRVSVHGWSFMLPVFRMHLDLKVSPTEVEQVQAIKSLMSVSALMGFLVGGTRYVLHSQHRVGSSQGQVLS